jgi:hypothetical protein
MQLATALRAHSLQLDTYCGRVLRKPILAQNQAYIGDALLADPAIEARGSCTCAQCFALMPQKRGPRAMLLPRKLAGCTSKKWPRVLETLLRWLWPDSPDKRLAGSMEPLSNSCKPATETECCGDETRRLGDGLWRWLAGRTANSV